VLTNEQLTLVTPVAVRPTPVGTSRCCLWDSASDTVWSSKSESCGLKRQMKKTKNFRETKNLDSIRETAENHKSDVLFHVLFQTYFFTKFQ
jgi:hypothetical protein